MAHTYQYPRAALTVDCVVFGFDEGELKVLLIERALEPFKGRWALPGGFVHVEETLDEAARRELEEEAGLSRGVNLKPDDVKQAIEEMKRAGIDVLQSTELLRTA